jgi:hypothetical protein
MRVSFLKVFAIGIFAAACLCGAQPTVTAGVTAATRGSCTLPPSQSIFSTTDAQVWFDFDYAGGNAGDNYAVQWFEPNGKLYTTFTFTQAATGGTSCYEYFIYLAGEPPANNPGGWTVDLLWNGTQIYSLPFTITAQASSPPQITTSGTLPGGTVATPYSQTLSATGGTPPYSWSVLGGGLPKGLSLSRSGTLAGTPSQAGASQFTIGVTDNAGQTASSVFGLTIAPQGLTITNVSPLPNGIVGSDYPPQIFTATGGNAPYTFQASGTLPGGLTFAGGEISGIPTTAGTFTFTVTATDSSNPALTASGQFKLTVQPAHADLILSQASLSFSLNLGATGLPLGASVSVRSSVAAQLLNYSVNVTPAAPWLDVSGGGTTPGAIRIGLDPSALSLAAGV